VLKRLLKVSHFSVPYMSDFRQGQLVGYFHALKLAAYLLRKPKIELIVDIIIIIIIIIIVILFIIFLYYYYYCCCCCFNTAYLPICLSVPSYRSDVLIELK